MHINVAELEAVLKGLNIAIAWGLCDINIMCDSATVCAWLRSVILDTHRPRVSGLSEMVVKPRLGIVAELPELHGLKLNVVLVPSIKNRADALTIVSKKWLCASSRARLNAVDVVALGRGEQEYPSEDAIRALHNLHHFGVDRTFYFVEVQYGLGNYRDIVKAVVQLCPQCQSIDPTPVRWDGGSLEVPFT